MTSFHKILLYSWFMVSVAACGGSTTSVSPDTPAPAPKPSTTSSYAERTKDITSRTSKISPFSSNYTALSNVPISGSATYNGYLYGAIKDDDKRTLSTLVSIAQLNVAFKNSNISIDGTAKKFKNNDNKDVAGQLTLSNGSFNRGGDPSNDATVNIEASGQLTDPKLGKITLGLRLEGDFFGPSPHSIGGNALGKADTSKESHQFDGGFIAQK